MAKKSTKSSTKKKSTKNVFKSTVKTMQTIEPRYKQQLYNGTYDPQLYNDAYNPGQYQSRYLPQIEQRLNDVANWQYDPLQDASYQALAAVYGARGNLAAKNSMADAAALNGGYGTSNAVPAAQQARNQYNQELMALIPDLEANAYQRASNGLNALLDVDNTMYGRFSDDESRKLQSKQFGLDVAGFNEGNRQFAANFGLDRYQANQNERQFGWNAKSTNLQQAAANAWDYLDYLDAQKAAANAGGGGGGGGRGGSGGGGGGYTGGGGSVGNTGAAKAPTLPDAKQSVIPAPGSSKSNTWGVNKLETIKKKNTTSGGRMVK